MIVKTRDSPLIGINQFAGGDAPGYGPRLSEMEE
jgi:hypothetical protein